MSYRILTILCALGAAVALACTSRDSHPDLELRAVAIAASEVSPDAVPVDVREYGIALGLTQFSDGHVDFLITNSGDLEHELFIVPMEGDRYGFPVSDYRHLLPLETRGLRVELPPGAYRLVCLVEQLEARGPGADSEPAVFSHRELGMETAFEVRP